MEADRSWQNSVMKAVIDTNVLIYIYTNRIDVFSQLKEMGFKKFIFPRQIIEELEKLERSLEGKEKRAARFALRIIEKCKECEIVEAEEEESDKAIIEVAKRYSAVIISNDRELMRLAKEEGITVGYLKEFRYVEIDDF